MELTDKSTMHRPEEIASLLECDESFDEPTRSLYCAYHMQNNRTVEEVLEAAKKTAEERLEKREKKDYMHDDIKGLYLIAADVERNMAAEAHKKFELSNGGSEAEAELETDLLAATRSRVYREKKAHEAIERKLAHTKSLIIK